MGDRKAEETNTADTSELRYDWKSLLTPLQLRTLSASSILLGSVVLLISVTTDHWLSDGRYITGLWGSCMKPICPTDADTLASEKEILEVTRSMMMLGVLCAGVSLLLISVSFFQNRVGACSLGRISAIASFAAGTFAMIGMSVYSEEFFDDREESSIEAEWSFDAGWVAFPLLYLAGSIAVVLSCVES
ncbi:epithelial membrane protein 2-like isoform X2 [Paroedura picta]